MADKVITDALERFRDSEAGSSEVRERALEDIEFARLSIQWPDDVRNQRRQEGRPCLTINRLPSFIRQVVNDARQNKPGLTVVPVDNGADFDTAQVIGGLIRSIERGSNAGVAYDTAVDHSVTGGFGFFRIATDYCHAETFDMEARIERVPNPFAVHWDTASTAFDASDWEFAFVSDMLSEREFKQKYPKAKPVSFQSGRGDDSVAEWIDGEKVRIAEYFLRTEKKRKIVQLSDGRVIHADMMDKAQEIAPGLTLKTADALAMMGITVNREREASYYTVKRRVMTGVEILSEDDWPGSMIPICPVWGEEVLYRGRRHFRSLVRDARDPQAMFNFWRSASTELVALAPRAPWLIPAGGIPNNDTEMQKWATANTRSHAYLTYNASAGPAPQRQPFASVPAGALQEALNASDDMKAVMGIYDASLGARSNETSGRAILARQRESDVSTYHFIDNLSRAIQYAGRVLIEIIPSVYSERQAIQILGPDEAPKVVRLMQSQGVPPSPDDPDGKIYDLSAGKYDVVVKVGPSYATQREEARVALMEVMAQVPGAALAVGDLAMSNMDFPQADEAAKRVKLIQAMELAKAGLPANVDQAIQVVESGQWPPKPPPPGADPMMQGAPPGALPVSGGM